MHGKVVEAFSGQWQEVISHFVTSLHARFLNRYSESSFSNAISLFFKILQMWNNFDVNNPDCFVNYVNTDDVGIIDACRK